MPSARFAGKNGDLSASFRDCCYPLVSGWLLSWPACKYGFGVGMRLTACIGMLPKELESCLKAWQMQDIYQCSEGVEPGGQRVTFRSPLNLVCWHSSKHSILEAIFYSSSSRLCKLLHIYLPSLLRLQASAVTYGASIQLPLSQGIFR